MQEILIKADHLSKTYTSGKKRIKAVDDICFEIPRGTTMSLVGESGSGKSTTGRMILRLLQPDTGSVFYNGIEITSKNISEFRSRMQIIFQSSSSSLDPALRIGDIIAEGLHPSGVFKKKGSDDGIVSSLLSSVGLSASDAQRYPREFSGGQQQRIGIARALAVEPEFIVCDEPVSALDVSCQSQILNLLLDLQAKKNMTYLFISHDLSVVTQISDTIGVMYAGKLVETGSCGEIFTHRQHPYTKMLFSSVPIPDPVKARARTRVILDAETAGGNAGCPFFSRCANALPCCRETKPALREIAPGHKCACHLFE